MQQSIIHIALVVRDYDEAIAFFCHKLHFTLLEDSYQPEQDKRWVVVAPRGSNGTSLLLARAATPEQSRLLANRREGEYSCSCERMTSGGITMKCLRRGSNLLEPQRLNLTER